MRTGARAVARRPAVAACAVSALAVALYLPTLWLGGPEMDEGTLVAYASFVRDGLVPGADFSTFYGPGQPWLVAGAFELFGESVLVERLIGIVLRILMALALLTMLWPLGGLWALVAASASVVALLPMGSGAFAIVAAIALAALSLASALRGLREHPATGGWPAAAAGVLAALALLFRWDLALAVALAHAPLVWRASGRGRAVFAAGAAAGLIPLLVWLVLLGPDSIATLLDDLQASRPGRVLPLGAVEPEFLVALAGGVVATLAALTSALLGWRRGRPAAPQALALGLFALGILPSALQRADEAHVMPFVAIALAAGLAAVPDLARLLGHRAPARSMIRVGCVGFVVLVCMSGIEGFGRERLSNPADDAVTVDHGEREFPIRDASAAASIEGMLARLSQESNPGDTLFVGPADLTRTNYTDTFVYFLVPELEPASFYTEVNNGTANAEDSGLAGELERADFVLLGGRWDEWDEPNDSREPGSSAPAEVVKEAFTAIEASGTYKLYERSDR